MIVPLCYQIRLTVMIFAYSCMIVDIFGIFKSTYLLTSFGVNAIWSTISRVMLQFVDKFYIVLEFIIYFVLTFLARMFSGMAALIMESIYCIICVALFIIVSFSFIWFQSIVGALRIFSIPCTCTLPLCCHSYLYHQSSRSHCGINTLLRNSLNLLSKNQAAMCELSTMFCCRYLAISTSSPFFSPGIKLCSSSQWKSAVLKVKKPDPDVWFAWLSLTIHSFAPFSTVVIPVSLSCTS